MKHLPLAILIATISHHGIAGDTRHNGGDLVTCRAIEGAKIHGEFVLDYLVGVTAAPKGAEELANLEEDVGSFLLEKIPAIGREFDEFKAEALQQIDATPNWSNRHVWRQRAAGLNTLKDEELTSPLPDNCYRGSGANRVVDLLQVVVREEMPTTRSIVFNYDARVYARISEDAAQFSFLMTHEWLWSHADNADVVRNINWYLHSKEARKASPSDLVYKLSNMGFRFSGKNPRGSTVEARVTYTGRAEPNRMPQFLVPELVVVGSDTKELVFVNTGAQRLVVRLIGADIKDICLLQRECRLPLDQVATFPAMFIIERNILRDPIWDSKIITVVR